MAQRLFNPFFVHTCRDIICGMLYRFRGVAHGNSNSRVSQHVEVVFRIAKRHAFQPRETEAREKRRMPAAFPPASGMMSTPPSLHLASLQPVGSRALRRGSSFLEQKAVA